MKFIISIYIDPDDTTMLPANHICDYNLSFEWLCEKMTFFSI